MSQTAKLFMNGRSQAVRLPKEFRFEGDEVYISRHGDTVIISSKPQTWDDFFDRKPAFDENFMIDREQSTAQERDF